MNGLKGYEMKIVETFTAAMYMLSSVFLYFFTYWGVDELLGGHDSLFSIEFFICALIMGFLFILPFNVLIGYPIALYGVSFLPSYYDWFCGGIITYRFVLALIVLFALWGDNRK